MTRPRYRIRWAVISTPVSRWSMQGRQRMCLAERLTWLGFYWPLRDGAWRTDEGQARGDIERDQAMREPLPPTTYLESDR